MGASNILRRARASGGEDRGHDSLASFVLHLVQSLPPKIPDKLVDKKGAEFGGAKMLKQLTDVVAGLAAS